jgi:hypothetical protein
MDDQLGVAMAAERVSPLLQPPPQFEVIEQFPIDDRSHGTGFVENRLLTVGNPYDAQTAACETYAAPHEKPLLVRATMDKAARHADEGLRIHGLLLPKVNDTRDPAHF